LLGIKLDNYLYEVFLPEKHIRLQNKMTLWWAIAKVSSYPSIHSFYTCVPSGEGHGDNCPRRSRNTSRPMAIIDSYAGCTQRLD